MSLKGETTTETIYIVLTILFIIHTHTHTHAHTYIICQITVADKPSVIFQAHNKAPINHKPELTK